MGLLGAQDRQGHQRTVVGSRSELSGKSCILADK